MRGDCMKKDPPGRQRPQNADGDAYESRNEDVHAGPSRSTISWSSTARRPRSVELRDCHDRLPLYSSQSRARRLAVLTIRFTVIGHQPWSAFLVRAPDRADDYVSVIERVVDVCGGPPQVDPS